MWRRLTIIEADVMLPARGISSCSLKIVAFSCTPAIVSGWDGWEAMRFSDRSTPW